MAWRFCNLLECLSDFPQAVARFDQQKSEVMERDMELRQLIWNLMGPEVPCRWDAQFVERAVAISERQLTTRLLGVELHFVQPNSPPQISE